MLKRHAFRNPAHLSAWQLPPWNMRLSQREWWSEWIERSLGHHMSRRRDEPGQGNKMMQQRKKTKYWQPKARFGFPSLEILGINGHWMESSWGRRVTVWSLASWKGSEAIAVQQPKRLGLHWVGAKRESLYLLRISPCRGPRDRALSTPLPVC